MQNGAEANRCDSYMRPVADKTPESISDKTPEFISARSQKYIFTLFTTVECIPAAHKLT